MPLTSPRPSRITMYANDDLAVGITVLNADGSTPDLAGATGTWWLAQNGHPAAQVYVKKTGSAVTFSQMNGSWVMSFALVPADTVNLAAGLYYHEAQVVRADGSMYTVLADAFVIEQTLIRP